MNEILEGMKRKKRNCHNCEYFEYFDDGYEGPTPGYMCNGRDYKTDKQEDKHLILLQDIKYTERPKKCCFLKGQP